MKIKEQILEILKSKPMTICKITEKLKLDDDLIVVAMIAELEIENKIELTNFKTCYEPDGCAVYLARYGLVKTHGASIM